MSRNLSLKIMFVASEAAPLAKTGGLADVVGSLPKELRKRGHDVRMIIPRYRSIAAEAGIRETGLAVAVRLPGRVEKADLYETSVQDIPVYLVGNDFYFDREFLYGSNLGDYPDNHRRYSFFCRAALLAMEKVGFIPEILHCHDWQTALIPFLLSRFAGDYPAFSGSATIFTIHNLAYQGVFAPGSVTEMGLPPEHFSIDNLEFYGNVNLMKGGIIAADRVTTVSETYRNEILGPEQGCGLGGVLAELPEKLTGIVNGIDYHEWDPATDRNIFSSYSASSPEEKRVNKKELQKTLGLEIDPDIPLLGIVSRIVAQKGFDLIAEILPRLVKARLQLAILGIGEEKYVRMLEELKERKLPNLSITIGFAGTLAPRIYAGADIFLMPSHFEPCGLGQLIALRYGTVPVVRRTGGLADTVIDCIADPARGTGFVFTEYTPKALYDCIGNALHMFERKKKWHQIVRRGMTQDFSWDRSAARYEEVYLQGLCEKRLKDD